jgi:hypothetical protein
MHNMPKHVYLPFLLLEIYNYSGLHGKPPRTLEETWGKLQHAHLDHDAGVLIHF